MFNTHTYLGRNAAVMIAWILLSCGTLVVFSWYMRRFEYPRVTYIPPSSARSSNKEVDKVIEEVQR